MATKALRIARPVSTVPVPRTVGLADDLASDAMRLHKLARVAADIQVGSVPIDDEVARGFVLIELLNAVAQHTEALATATAELHARLAT